MASTILSGTGNVTYTNSTGQNVRVVINYMSGTNITFTWATGATATAATYGNLYPFSIGKNIAFDPLLPTSSAYGRSPTNMCISTPSTYTGGAPYVNGVLPTEIFLTTGQTFAASDSTGSTNMKYNIVIVKEDGT